MAATTFVDQATPIVASWLNDTDTVVYGVKHFGAKGDGVTDDTAAFQAAIDYVSTLVVSGTRGGGKIFIPAGAYTLTGTLSITSSFISLIGEGTQATFLNFANGAQDCFVIDGATSPGGILRDVRITDLAINGNGFKSAGASVKFSNSFRCSLDRVAIDNCITGVDIGGGTNWTRLSHVSITPNQPGSLYGIWWHCAADGSTRSDVLTLEDVIVEGQWSNADCFVWDGMCNTLVGDGLRLLHAKNGLRILNTANSASYYPAFANVHDFEAEGFKTRALEILGGNDFKFSDFDITNLTSYPSQGNADDYAIYIDADVSHSVTRGVQLANGRVGLCRSNAIYSDSRYLQMANVICVGASYAAVNSAAAVRLGANSSEVQIANLTAEEFGGAARCSYAVQIDSGATRIQGSNVSALYCNTGHILNNSSGQVGFYNTINTAGNIVHYVGTLLANYANDAAAAAGGVAVGGWYRNGSVKMQRVA